MDFRCRLKPNAGVSWAKCKHMAIWTEYGLGPGCNTPAGLSQLHNHPEEHVLKAQPALPVHRFPYLRLAASEGIGKKKETTIRGYYRDPFLHS